MSRYTYSLKRSAFFVRTISLYLPSVLLGTRLTSPDFSKLFSEIPVLRGERIEFKSLTSADAPALKEMTDDREVYRYLPAFLFEKKYPDVNTVIERLYDECIEESLILGVFLDGEFCGLAEFYGCRADDKKISVGSRFMRRYWGRGIASETLELMLGYLFSRTDIKLVAASTMVDNKASEAVLRKNGFTLASAEAEDWGFEQPVLTHIWIKNISRVRN